MKRLLLLLLFPLLGARAESPDELVQLVWELRARLVVEERQNSLAVQGRSPRYRSTFSGELELLSYETAGDQDEGARRTQPPTSTSTPGTPSTCSSLPASGTQSSVSALQPRYSLRTTRAFWWKVTATGGRSQVAARTPGHPRLCSGRGGAPQNSFVCR